MEKCIEASKTGVQHLNSPEAQILQGTMLNARQNSITARMTHDVPLLAIFTKRMASVRRIVRVAFSFMKSQFFSRIELPFTGKYLELRSTVSTNIQYNYLTTYVGVLTQLNICNHTRKSRKVTQRANMQTFLHIVL